MSAKPALKSIVARRVRASLPSGAQYEKAARAAADALVDALTLADVARAVVHAAANPDTGA